MKDNERKVWSFFYGSYLNLGVLGEVDLVPTEWEPASLNGFDIVVAPRANLVPSEGSTVYGIVATATHRELSRLYAHAENVLGERYEPEAVLVQTFSGRWVPALCYVSTTMEPRPAEADYVGRIVEPATEYEFPDWYLEKLRSFSP